MENAPTMKKDLLSIHDLSAGDYNALIETSLTIKRNRAAYGRVFEGKTAVMIFDKPSLRTRVTFEVAMNQFGGRSIYLPGQDISLGKRESFPDGARNLSRWVDAIIVRTFGHEIVEELAKYATIPVINALTDHEHPCQALACLMTLREKWDVTSGKTMVFVGDGNNVAHSLMLLAPLAGMHFVICCPKGYEPSPSVAAEAAGLAARSGVTCRLDHNIQTAVPGADIIYTDVWASMGQEDEAAAREKLFRPYQVNASLMTLAGPHCLVSHCLPAHRGEEITSDVLDSPASIAIDEAENRLHVQKGVLYRLLGG
jgi:ornithine carbamoyltransferase